MSWMKKRTPSASPALVPPGQIFNPNQQPYGQQPNVQWHQPEVPQQQNWYNPNTQPNAYWQPPQQPPLQQQPSNQNVNSTQQYQNYNQYTNSYNQNQNFQNHTLQNSYNPNLQYGVNNPNVTAPQSTEADPWNWGWGEENNSNKYPQPVPNQNPTNNVVEDSFSNNDESWNWSVEDSAAGTITLPNQQLEAPDMHHEKEPEKDNATFQTMGKLAHSQSMPLEELSQSSGSRPKSENLTPQWSIESQVSQDSSDDVIQTSESDNHSHAVSQSQSSTVSQSPTLDAATKSRSSDAYEKDLSNKMVNITLKEHHRQVENNEVLTTTAAAHKEDYLSSPSLVQNTKATQPPKNSRTASLAPVNLETLPDNSEQPDSMPHQFSAIQQAAAHFMNPDNYEVAPINDRNQYLETGQLSDVNTRQYNQSSAPAPESVDALPPPGLRRMVLGQMEQIEDSTPPVGLSRMVLGQTEASAAAPESPPHMNRMVPGESSSPEENLGGGGGSRRMRTFASYQETQDYVYDSEPAVPERSATIGADTPPSIEPRDTNLDGANTLDDTADVQAAQQDSRRDSIEGEPQDAGLQQQLLLQNPTDGANSVSSIGRISGRQDSSDSDREQDKEPKVRKSPARFGKDNGRQYYDKKERSPDRQRDRKYDRKKYGDRPYEEESDYYSEREYERERRYKGDRERREEEDAKKYRSLKREKERKPRRPVAAAPAERDRDYDRGDRRRDYYYHPQRYEDEYYRDPQRSRPSSRSDSMHEYYREGPASHEGRERKPREQHSRRHRDNYNSYAQGFGYDPYNNPYYQQYQYQYYENLRRTNPQAYAEMYRKYYQQQGAATGAGGSVQGGNAFSTEDRASVHSGRSSANGGGVEFNKHRLLSDDHPDNSMMSFADGGESAAAAMLQQASRSTPAKFATPHVKAAIASGRLVKVLPHYPLDGQTAVVEVFSLHTHLMHDPEYRQLADFPGPLVKGVTHKKTVIEYCENKIREAAAVSCQEVQDIDACVLMWDLLILLLRQNGVVVGTDIAELLMKSAGKETKEPSGRTSVSSANSAPTESMESREIITGSTTSLKEDIVTNKFREYLIYGSEKEALEWAMKHGLWGHALFLASKLDKRTYANVMTRFANGLPLNDPLQTLYQLLSGRQPAAVTCVSDEKWGDWKPHLAMILSNTSQRPELDRKAITTLGDTLTSRGNLYSAQFCYLMAQVGFSRYGTPGAKLVLLGSSHANPFDHFATNDAIHMSEIYEYACSLNDDKYIIPEFQPYKYLLATRLADRGLLEKALAYLERVSQAIIQDTSIVTSSLIEKVYNLSDKLKHYDLVSNSGEDDGVEEWLQKLFGAMQNSQQMGYQRQHSLTEEHNSMSATLAHQESSAYAPETLDSSQYVNNQDTWQQQQQQQQHYYQQQSSMPGELQSDSSLHPQPEYALHQDDQPSLSNDYSNAVDQTQNYWQNQTSQSWSASGLNSDHSQMTASDQSVNDNYWGSDAQNQQPEKVDDEASNGTMQPQISMPNQASKKGYEDSDETFKKPPEKTKKANEHAKPAANKSNNPGWFGGLWNKLALRPKNQMKLPDDKNPTIVWDSDKNKWVNLEADHDESSAALKPPPKMSDMFPNTQQQMHAPQMQMQQHQPAFSENASNPPMQMPMQMPIQQPLMTNNQLGGMKENIKPMAQPNPGFETQGVPSNNFSKPPAVPNMFKMPKGRTAIKKSYVDVFNPGGNKSSGGTPAAPILGADSFQSLPSQMNYFVPAPVTNSNSSMDFLTPTPNHKEEEHSQM